MDKVNELREEARVALDAASAALDNGEVEQAQKAREDAVSKVETAAALEAEKGKLEVLSGDFNMPTNSVPLSYEEAKLYNPADEGKDYRNDYKPQNWVKGLPAAVQPTWVRGQMGYKLKAE